MKPSIPVRSPARPGRPVPALALAVLLAAGCAGVDTPAPEAAGATPPAADAQRAEAAATEPVDAPEEKPKEVGDRAGISRALGEVLDEGAAPEGLELEMGCLTDEGFTTLTVYANGVGIWNQTSQFELTAPELRDIVAAFREHGFADLELYYGGKKDPAPKVEGEGGEGSGASATRVTCRISLELRGAAKAVTQLYGGRQSPALRQLADGLFALASGPAEGGVTAASLADGLGLIAEGTLAPEALSVLLHRKGEVEGSDDGWILRLDGRTASLRPYLPSEGLGETVALELSPEELAGVAEAVRAADPAELPTNLWALDYTDFSVRLLNHKETVQARQFAGMDPDQHGALQAAFDRMVAELAELAERVRVAGQPVAG